jgi:hypothetical protein
MSFNTRVTAGSGATESAALAGVRTVVAANQLCSGCINRRADRFKVWHYAQSLSEVLHVSRSFDRPGVARS